MKDRIRLWIHQNLLGYPTEVKNLLDYIESFNGDICIYPGGEYNFGIKSIYDQQKDETITFRTPQEREAFSAGLSHGISIMGGSTHLMKDQDLTEFEEMDNLSNVNTNTKKIH